MKSLWMVLKFWSLWQECGDELATGSKGLVRSNAEETWVGQWGAPLKKHTGHFLFSRAPDMFLMSSHVKTQLDSMMIFYFYLVWLFGKNPDAGKDWDQEKWVTEDEMVGWHHWLKGHEFEKALGDGEGHGSLVCCNPWGHRVGHNWATEQ